MRISLIFLAFFFSLATFAGIEQAPPSFFYNYQKIVWADFQDAHYSLVYDIKKQKATATTTINFHLQEAGYPVFDNVTTPTKVYINGEETRQSLIPMPQNVTQARIVETYLEAGDHQLIIESPISNGTRWNRVSQGPRHKKVVSVASGFFIKDLTDRLFLEKYVPSNYEYDQYKMTFDVKILNSKVSHNVFANGDVTELAKNHIRIEYPQWYGSSSVFFHLVPKSRFVRYYLTYPSIDGRQIPIIIYSAFRFFNKMLKDRAFEVLAELENDYGPWPHPQVLIYGNNIRGGMEYPGATATSLVSLGHELQHSYFAKGLVPANGNSGWMDEAIASWRDKGHQTHELPFFSHSNIGGQSIYKRNTDKRSYEYGRSFMAYVDYRLKEIGKAGLKDFLRQYFEKRKFTTVTTEDFRSDLEEYAQMSFELDFDQYIYGQSTEKNNVHSHYHENPHHPQLTIEELESLI